MNKLKLKKLLKEMSMNEEKVNGLDITKKAQKEAGKQNKDYYKEVGKKMSDYEEPVMPKDDEEVDKFNKPGNIEGDSKEYHDQMEIMNGQEMINPENTNDRFEERAKMAIEGDALMGNNPEWANVVTADQQGFTGPDFGKNLQKGIESSKKKRQKGEERINSPVTSVSDRDLDDSKINENKKIMKKRLRFKKPFDGVGNALNLIPENYKVDSKEFEMTDGNETYDIRWEGDLTEGKAVILKAADQTYINEDMDKMKHLMGFSSNKTLGRLQGNERLNENESFKDVWDLTQNLMTENATGVAGMGFVAESDYESDYDMAVEKCVRNWPNMTYEQCQDAVASGEITEGEGGHGEHIMSEDEVNEDEVVTEDEVNEDESAE